MCKNIDQINATILRLEAAGLEFCRIKNRFNRTFKATELSAGYRDLQLNVRIPGTGLIWELQIHLADIEKLKSHLRDQDDGSGRTGHARYIAFRTIMELLTAILLPAIPDDFESSEDEDLPNMPDEDDSEDDELPPGPEAN